MRPISPLRMYYNVCLCVVFGYYLMIPIDVFSLVVLLFGGEHLVLERNISGIENCFEIVKEGFWRM